MLNTSIRSRFLRLALLGALFTAFFGASASWAAPIKAQVSAADRAAAKVALHEKRAQFAKAHMPERNERGQFLPKVNEVDVQARAYQKYEARNREDGHDREDFVAAKRELQNEKMAQNKAIRAQKAQLKIVAAH